MRQCILKAELQMGLVLFVPGCCCCIKENTLNNLYWRLLYNVCNGGGKVCVLWLLSHSSWAVSSWNFCLSVCFRVLFSIVVFNMYMRFRKYFVCGDTEYSFKKMFLWKKKAFKSLKFSEVFVRAALRAGRCSGLYVTTFGQLYLELSPLLSMTVVLTDAK